jgi:hypothetical protein
MPESPQGKESRFLLILNRNKKNDALRKQLLARNYSRRTKSQDLKSLPSLTSPGRLNGHDIKLQKEENSHIKIPILEKKITDICLKPINKKIVNFDSIKEKFRKSSTNRLQEDPPKNLKEKERAARKPTLFLSHDLSIKKVNFCDFFGPALSKKVFPTKRPLNKPRSKCPVDLLAAEMLAKSLKLGDPRPLLLKSKSLPLVITECKDYSDFRLRKSKSFHNLEVCRKVVHKKARIAFRISKKDSIFVNQYFQLKDKMYNKVKNTSLNDDKTLVQVNSFIFHNYQSYWMRSIDDLLSMEVIGKIKYGYYRNKNISYAGFITRNQIEQMLSLLRQDILKEALKL